MNEVVHLDRHRKRTPQARTHPNNKFSTNSPPAVFFDRRELNRILSLYGRMVSVNEWHDYAIDSAAHSVEFQVFRNSWDSPAYRLVKRDPGARGRRFAVVRGRETMIEDDRLQAILIWLERRPAERISQFPQTRARERTARRP